MIGFQRLSHAALGALVLGFGFGVAPSCKALPASETMVILQTDLSLPKDVDKVTIEVLVRGDRRHFNTFEKLGNEDSLKIPASIGLTLDDGTDPSTPVTFRVTAFQLSKARVLREVVTTIPKDRLVALRLPIQWLCWDQVQSDAEGNPQTTCPENQTCIAGTCADKTVDPTTLDDYAPDQVFGGGSGTNNDGACFDTSACFDASQDAPLDLTACTIAATDDMNVAIRVDSAGICGAAGCFVPLDAKSDLGWQAGKSGTIQLPAAICQRIKDGKAAGVSVVAATTACPLKTSSLPTCGPWSSAGKAPPSPAELGPVTLSGNQQTPVSIAVAAGNVYWTVPGPYYTATAAGSVKKIAIEGGSPTIVQGMQAYPRDLAITTDSAGKLTDLIWASAGNKKDAGSPLLGAALTDRRFTSSTMFMDGNLSFKSPLVYPEGVAVNATSLFFTDLGASAVYSVDPKTLGVTLIAGPTNGLTQNGPYRIAADDSNNLLWTNQGDGSVMIYDLAKAQLDVLAPMQETPRSLVLDIPDASLPAKAVYWANYGSDAKPAMKIMKATISDRVVTPLAQAMRPSGLAVDKDAVYWTDQGDNTVMKLTKADGKTHKLAEKQNVPGAITVDATSIYWINVGTAGNPGSIMRISKAAPELK